MKPVRILTLIGLLSALQACGGSTPFTESPPLQTVVEQECERPVRLPEGGLSQAQVESLWIRDRVSLIECGEKLRLAIGAQ